MSGSLDVLGAHLPRAVHDRLIVNLDNGKELRFLDPRKFGRAYLVTDYKEVTGDLGPEPLSPELSSDEFSKRISAHRGALKPLLLNQRVIAGLGNIYVDEALWRARIHPTVPAARVPVKRMEELFRSIQEVLTEAIKHQGTDFGDGVVVYGGYRPQVYGRAGEPCARCGALIKRIVVSQRGTHFCPRCQRSARSQRPTRSK
jgi:formamidopyrimidine-DNA glycosylase